MVGKLTNVKYRELSPVTVIVTLIPQGWLDDMWGFGRCDAQKFFTMQIRASER